MNIKIKRQILLYKDYKFRCSVGKSGITNSKKEGDLSTPKGIFKLGTLYYRRDRIKLPPCKIKKRIIKKDMGWCDDIRSNKYNKEISFPFRWSAEKLYKKSKNYDMLIVIKYNYTKVVKKKGSAIFLHLTSKKYKSTEGCIAIMKKHFLKILPLINGRTKIIIS